MTKNQNLLHTLQTLILAVAKGKNVGANFALAANLVAASIITGNEVLTQHFAEEVARMVDASEKRVHSKGVRKGQPYPYRAEAVLRGALLASGAKGRRSNANLQAAIDAIVERENHTEAQKELFAKAKETTTEAVTLPTPEVVEATHTPVMAAQAPQVVRPMSPEEFAILVGSAEERAKARAKARLVEAIEECITQGVEPTLA